MSDIVPLESVLPHTAPMEPTASDVVDPRLLERAVRRMRGLVTGNGLLPEYIALDTHTVKILRFQAYTTLKLVTEYGIRPEPGRNTLAEPVASEEDFRRTLTNIVSDAITNPLKRQQIIDTVNARSDKGFGLSEQNMGFHTLDRTLVRHEKCVACKALGRIDCARCHGNRVMNCTRCIGKRQIACPRCRGSTHIQTAQGQKRCTFCHGDGLVPCGQCAGRGQVKCLTCKGHGSMACQTCAATGWISHIAVVKFLAQMKFSFDKQKIPLLLSEMLAKNPARLVARHDIEIAIKPDNTADPIIDVKSDISGKTGVAAEAAKVNDTIVIHFNVTCPLGPISFKNLEPHADVGIDPESPPDPPIVPPTPLAGTLFGYQARLLDMPPFLDTLTTTGQKALMAASVKGANIKDLLPQAIRFAFLHDVFLKMIVMKNPKHVHALMFEKYGAGIGDEKLRSIVGASYLIIRHTTRNARYIGMALGLFLYAAMLAGFITQNDSTLTGVLYAVVLGLCPILGILMGIGTARLCGVYIQRHHFAGLIEDAILRKNFPKSGKVLWWSVGLSLVISAVLIFGGIHFGYIAELF